MVAVSPERGDTPLPIPLPELDPETLRGRLRDFLQELREAQRERVGWSSTPPNPPSFAITSGNRKQDVTPTPLAVYGFLPRLYIQPPP